MKGINVICGSKYGYKEWRRMHGSISHENGINKREAANNGHFNFASSSSFTFSKHPFINYSGLCR